MNGVPSPGATLTRAFDPLKEEEPAIRRISRDFKRSSVSSSNSKVSIESLKLKHKQTIMIDSDECDVQDENEDYMQMNLSGDQVVRDQLSSYEDECEDYVETDVLPSSRFEEYVETDILPVPRLYQQPPAPAQSKEENEQKKKEKKEDVCAGSDTISTATLQADVNVTEERQMNAVSLLLFIFININVYKHDNWNHSRVQNDLFCDRTNSSQTKLFIILQYFLHHTLSCSAPLTFTVLRLRRRRCHVT